MEKIRLKSGQEFDLVPVGIREDAKRRSFIIYADGNIENAFSESNIDRIEYISESGEVLKTYLDCVKTVAIGKDIENGTYTVEVSIDAVERRLKEVDAQMNDLANTIVMMSMI